MQTLIIVSALFFIACMFLGAIFLASAVIVKVAKFISE